MEGEEDKGIRVISWARKRSFGCNTKQEDERRRKREAEREGNEPIRPCIRGRLGLRNDQDRDRRTGKVSSNSSNPVEVEKGQCTNSRPSTEQRRRRGGDRREEGGVSSSG